ncbi:hypothetical protein OAB57_00770 [Bacteriovoracaceae bacterium]|nr:hypothetical protein [Bacteriovoracaceae bacterium]
MKFIQALCVIFIVGCSRLGTINMDRHYFGSLPTKIVWLQVAGFDDSQLGLFKFGTKYNNEKLGLEKFTCLGKTWLYNIYDFRPSVNAGFLSQLTGKMNFRNKCDDFNMKPIWKYFNENGHETALFEVGFDKGKGIDRVLSCTETKDQFLDDVVSFKMAFDSKKEHPRFHVDGKNLFQTGKIYYDRSCRRDKCYRDTAQNIKFVFEKFTKNKNRYLYIMRFNNLYKALKKNNWTKSKDILAEINSIYEYFYKISLEDTSLLVLLTSTNPIKLNYPVTNKQWSNFDRNIILRSATSSGVLGTVFATGARAENFCGIYQENDIFKRIMTGSKRSFWRR